MKKIACLLAAVTLLVSIFAVLVSAAEKEKTSVEKSAPKGSIRPTGKLKATERLALAKISYEDALTNALAAVSGKVVGGDLEVEDGNLQFTFQIITPAKKVMDVAIDAGDGKVLSTDEGDDE